MARITDRDGFIDYCMRRLGAPVIEINISPEQAEDRLDDALKYFEEYHFEGSEKSYYKHTVTQEDKDNRYIELPENVMAVTKVFNSSVFAGSYGLFDVRYQIALNDLYSLNSRTMIPYFMTMQHLSLMEQILVGQREFRYQRHTNKLYIDTNWQKYNVDSFLIIEVTQSLSPDEYTDIWNDRWFQRYATCLMKQQWGENLSKFKSIPLPGGMVLNGGEILAAALSEKAQLEGEMINSYSEPLVARIG